MDINKALWVLDSGQCEAAGMRRFLRTRSKAVIKPHWNNYFSISDLVRCESIFGQNLHFSSHKVLTRTGCGGIV
ncbi:hypothetical protein, partial [Aquitalea sp. FJL05]|uniref:hypothetical protein n=1 Tax=Aquitalea sp. FJL05 TaxID=2153366 RepID=UPI001F24C73E